MIVAGLTGTIGTGKSMVAAMFQELGAFIIDVDKIAHDVVEPGEKVWKDIVDKFGSVVLNSDQTIDRQKLADIVFKDKDKLQILNSIIHPAVVAEDVILIKELKAKNHRGLIINDIPLLIELGQEITRQLADIVIVVYCAPELQLKRLLARGMKKSDALNRIKNQIPIQEKIQLADFVINNSGTLTDSRRQVLQVYNAIMRK